MDFGVQWVVGVNLPASPGVNWHCIHALGTSKLVSSFLIYFYSSHSHSLASGYVLGTVFYY